MRVIQFVAHKIYVYVFMMTLYFHKFIFHGWNTCKSTFSISFRCRYPVDFKRFSKLCKSIDSRSSSSPERNSLKWRYSNMVNSTVLYYTHVHLKRKKKRFQSMLNWIKIETYLNSLTPFPLLNWDTDTNFCSSGLTLLQSLSLNFLRWWNQMFIAKFRPFLESTWWNHLRLRKRM